MGHMSTLSPTYPSNYMKNILQRCVNAHRHVHTCIPMHKPIHTYSSQIREGHLLRLQHSVQSTFEWRPQHSIIFKQEVHALATIGPSDSFFLAATSGPSIYIFVRFDCGLRGSIVTSSEPLTAYVGEDDYVYSDPVMDQKYLSDIEQTWECVEARPHSTLPPASGHSNNKKNSPTVIHIAPHHTSTHDGQTSHNKKVSWTPTHEAPSNKSTNMCQTSVSAAACDVHSLAACLCTEGPERALLVSGSDDRTAAVWDVSSWHAVVQARESSAYVVIVRPRAYSRYILRSLTCAQALDHAYACCDGDICAASCL
jgi:WD40 repeat protein